MNMNVKRLAALALALVMLLSLCACGGDEDVRGTVESDSTTTANTTTVADEATTTTTAADETDDDFVVGTASGNTYTNTFIGIGYKLDAEWTLFDDEQMKQMNEQAMEMAGEEYAEMLKNAKVIYDMYAQNTTTGESMNVNLENLGLVYGSMLDEAAYVQIALPSLKDGLESMGFSSVNAEAKTVTFAGEEHAAIYVTGDMNGITIHEIAVCVKRGKYMSCITVASFEAARAEALLNGFYAV